MLPMKTSNDVLNNESGFTMLEAVMTIFIFTLILSFIPFMYQSFVSIERSIELEEEYEWNLFLIQLRNELQGGDQWQVRGSRLFIEKNHLVIQYEPYGQVVRRRVNETGHEIVLQSVEKIQLFQQEKQLIMAVTFFNGKEKEARFSTQDDKGGEKSDPE